MSFATPTAGPGHRRRRTSGDGNDGHSDPTLAARSAPCTHPYFLFIDGSSTNIPQKPLGFTFEAFFTTLIFIVLS